MAATVRSPEVVLVETDSKLGPFGVSPAPYDEVCQTVTFLDFVHSPSLAIPRLTTLSLFILACYSLETSSGLTVECQHGGSTSTYRCPYSSLSSRRSVTLLTFD